MLNETQRIMENWSAFAQAWPAMWLAFGQKAPGDRDALTLDVWSQCQHIPAGAWEYLLQRVRDMDSKPRNWAKTLKALHYQWTETLLPPEAKPERSRDCDGPIGRRITQLRNRGMSAMQAMQMAVQEEGKANGAH